MRFDGVKVLLLDAYARQTLPIARGFKKIGCIVTVVCFSKLDVGYSSNVPDYRILLKCKKDDYNSQYLFVKKLIETGEYDIVVPMNDYSAIYLANNKDYLKQFAQIAVNDKKIFELAINKVNTMRVCKENGIPSPITIFSNNISEILSSKELIFPVVVKPETACGSIGFNIVDNKMKLEELLTNSVFSGHLFVQEYIPQDGVQYGVEAFRNNDGSYAFILVDEKPRWYPLDGGSPTINITTHNDTMTNMAKRLLDSLNWVGYANIDFVVDCRNQQPKVIEINARISAAVSIDEAVGYNVSELICRNVFNKESLIYSDYIDNIKVSCILTELLWFVKSKNRFKNKPTMFNRKKTKDVIFRWKDPKPFFTFSLQSIKNYKHAMKLRKRG